MELIDNIIVGSGLRGGVIARLLVDAGRDVLISERRNHLGGNVYDYEHPSGVKIHACGPQYFRCNLEEIWNFMNRFSLFQEYQARIKTLVDNNI